MCGEEGCGASALLGRSRHLSWDFPSRARAGPRGASALCLLQGIWHVSAEAPGASPEAAAPPPPLLAAPPAQPLAQARQCSDRRFVLSWMPGRRRKPHTLTCRRLPGMQISATESGVHPTRNGAAPRVCGSPGGGLRLPRASGCLRRDPPHTCPPRSSSPLCCSARSPGRGGAGRVVSTYGPGLDPGKEG